DRVVAETEIALGLAARRDDHGLASLRPLGADVGLGGADHGGVVRTAETAIGREHDLADTARLQPRHEQRIVRTRACGLEIADDFGDPVGVGLRRLHARLRLDDARRRDELHGARDLLRRLHRPDAPAENPLLPSRHRYSFAAVGWKPCLNAVTDSASASPSGSAPVSRIFCMRSDLRVWT